MIFHLTATVTISLTTDVEANTREEALAIAEERDLVTLWATYQDDPKTEWVTSGELDGPVENVCIEPDS